MSINWGSFKFKDCIGKDMAGIANNIKKNRVVNIGLLISAYRLNQVLLDAF